MEYVEMKTIRIQIHARLLVAVNAEPLFDYLKIKYL